MKNSILKIILILSFTIFVASYFIEETGYYDYKLQEKTIREHSIFILKDN